MKKVNKSGKKGNAETIRQGEGKFNFPNGDCYEGGYLIINNKEIYRHGYGVYKTSDQDEYRAIWEKDRISSNLHIVYGNKAEYEGEINDECAMTGKATYTFPDGTALKAFWQNNEPASDFLYKDQLGYHWLGKITWTNREVVFSPENHIWDKYLD